MRAATEQLVATRTGALPRLRPARPGAAKRRCRPLPHTLPPLLALQVRAPMPPTYVFVIDVSFAAAACGMLGAVCATIRECLDALPGDERTQVAFITYDRRARRLAALPARHTHRHACQGWKTRAPPAPP